MSLSENVTDHPGLFIAMQIRDQLVLYLTDTPNVWCSELSDANPFESISKIQKSTNIPVEDLIVAFIEEKPQSKEEDKWLQLEIKQGYVKYKNAQTIKEYPDISVVHIETESKYLDVCAIEHHDGFPYLTILPSKESCPKPGQWSTTEIYFRQFAGYTAYIMDQGSNFITVCFIKEPD